MSYYIYQEDLDKIGDEYKQISNMTLVKHEIIPSVIVKEIVTFKDLDNLKDKYLSLNIPTAKFVNCNLDRDIIKLNGRIESTRVIDSTISKVIFEGCKGIMIVITDSFIDELVVTQNILNQIYIDNSVVNRIKIYDTVIRGGLHISLDSTVKSISLNRSLIDNTRVVLDNYLMNDSDNELNPEKLYEENLEDAANNFVLLNACVIGNNSSDELYDYDWVNSIVEKDICANANNNIIAGVYRKGDITDKEVKY